MAAIAAGVACDANAQDVCGAYISQTIAVRSFSAIAAELPLDLRKDEFETTDQFQARVATTSSAAQPRILDRPVDKQTFPAPLEYDADAGTLKVRQSAFQWGTTEWWRAARRATAGEVASVVPGWNVATVISRTSRTTGSYNATNAFGVRREVFRSVLTTQGVFDRGGREGDEDMFVVGPDDVVGQISMPSEEARTAKARLRFALVIQPKWPFLVSGSDLKSGPSIDDAREVHEDYQVMFADVLCGLVVDQGVVVASFPTRDSVRPPTASRGLFTQ